MSLMSPVAARSMSPFESRVAAMRMRSLSPPAAQAMAMRQAAAMRSASPMMARADSAPPLGSMYAPGPMMSAQGWHRQIGAQQPLRQPQAFYGPQSAAAPAPAAASPHAAQPAVLWPSHLADASGEEDDDSEFDMHLSQFLVAPDSPASECGGTPRLSHFMPTEKGSVNSGPSPDLDDFVPHSARGRKRAVESEMDDSLVQLVPDVAKAFSPHLETPEVDECNLDDFIPHVPAMASPARLEAADAESDLDDFVPRVAPKSAAPNLDDFLPHGPPTWAGLARLGEPEADECNLDDFVPHSARRRDTRDVSPSLRLSSTVGSTAQKLPEADECNLDDFVPHSARRRATRDVASPSLRLSSTMGSTAQEFGESTPRCSLFAVPPRPVSASLRASGGSMPKLVGALGRKQAWAGSSPTLIRTSSSAARQRRQAQDEPEAWDGMPRLSNLQRLSRPSSALSGTPRLSHLMPARGGRGVQSLPSLSQSADLHGAIPSRRQAAPRLPAAGFSSVTPRLSQFTPSAAEQSPGMRSFTFGGGTPSTITPFHDSLNDSLGSILAPLRVEETDDFVHWVPTQSRNSPAEQETDDFAQWVPAQSRNSSAEQDSELSGFMPSYRMGSKHVDSLASTVDSPRLSHLVPEMARKKLARGLADARPNGVGWAGSRPW